MANEKIIKISPIGFQWETESPFLFCVHHRDAFPKGNSAQGIDNKFLRGRNIGSDFEPRDGFRMYHGKNVPGFPVHPHRGFETVTVVTEGFVDHFDSRGSAGRYGQGDVQWMTAGSGCQHSEMFPLVFEDKPNPAELFQIWLNLPAKDKFTEPQYKMLWSEDIPVTKVQVGEKSASVRIISGKFNGIQSLAPCPASWANNPANRVGIFLISMKPGSAVTLPAISETLVRNLYFYEGTEISVEGTAIHAENRIKLDGNSEIAIKNGDAPAGLLLLEGEPIREPVFQYGPFVMNTEAEIRQAFLDYRETEFGGWPWDRPDPVHERNAGRFASYTDGREERR